MINIAIKGPKEKIEKLCPILGGLTEVLYGEQCTLTGDIGRTKDDSLLIHIGDITISLNMRDLTFEEFRAVLGIYR